MSTGDATEDDYSTNIDEQLLAAVGKATTTNESNDDANDMTRIKLEQIAAHATTSKSKKVRQSQQHTPQPENEEDQLKKYQQMQQQQEQQQQHHHHHQQQQHHHHQQLAAAAAAAAAAGIHQSQAHHLGDLSNASTTDELSEYNIQIPEPIIDSKSKIYPVIENTITANGNLITRPYPEQIFHNRDDLNDFIQEFARDNGFGVVIAHSNKKAIYYTCELGGRYRQKKSKKDQEEEPVDESHHIDVGDGYMLDPNTKTKKLKCPFSMTASFKKSTGVWTLRTTCNEHNHPQLDPLSNHPMLRKRSDELNLLILDLYKVGTKPSHIEAKIKEQYPDVLIKREDIYNEIRGYKRKLKKQTARFGQISSARLSNYRRRTQQLSSQQGQSQGDDAAAAAAVAAAAANANAFLHQDEGSEVLYDIPHHQIHHQVHHPSQQQLHQLQQQQQHAQQHQHSQQHSDEFQRQFNEASAAVESQYQQYQYDGEGNNNSGSSSSAVAIAAVANAARAAASGSNERQHYNNDDELSIDNIDSRLVGE